MAKGVNRVTLLGHMGKAAEMRTTRSGAAVANFSIATTRGVKDASGKWSDVTDWHSCVAFGRTAEVVRDYTGKGSKIYLEGRLETSSWEKDGQRHYRTSVVVDDLTLLGAKSERQPGSDESERGGYSASSGYPDQSISDEDIPF